MVLTLVRPISAFLLALALVAAPVQACAGWAASPGARMACCDGDGICPMHAADSRDGGSSRAVSQAEADDCCAASEQSAPGSTSAAFALAAPTPAASVVPHAAASVRSTYVTWRAHVPLARADVPKHLLLSVLLV